MPPRSLRAKMVLFTLLDSALASDMANARPWFPIKSPAMTMAMGADRCRAPAAA